MGDNSTPTKFDNKIKDVLNNYQADFDTTDWSKMESKLNVTSASKTFNVKYILYGLIGLAVAGGAYFIFNAIDFKSAAPIEETVIPKIEIENKAEPAVVKEEKIIPPVVDSTLLKQAEIKEKEIVPEEETVVADKIKTKEETEKVVSKKEKKKNQKEEKSKQDDDGIKPEKVYTMGNEPVFGDMLDSSKGIIGGTKESDKTKKAAKTSSDVPVGWNTFMLKNVNVDSLRKYREKKDSIK